MAACSLRMLLWSLPGYATFEISRRWLQAQAIIYPPTCILLLVSPLNAILSYLFIWGPESLQLGFIGAPVATVISFNLMGLSCLSIWSRNHLNSFLYCARVAGQQGWPGCDRRALRDLGPNFCLGLSGFTTLASEWWFWEFIGIASSRLGPTALAAQSVIVMYQFSGGASLAVAGRYGNLIGGGCTRRAGYASYAALGTGFLFGTLTMLAMVVSQEEVVALVAKVVKPHMPRAFATNLNLSSLVDCSLSPIRDGSVLYIVYAGFPWLNDSSMGLGSTLAGVIRGAGKPKVGALINSIGYYVVGLPVGIFLTFSQLQLGIRGLWLGMLMAVTWTAIASSYYVFTKIIPTLISCQKDKD
ncbi:hypothetical protein PSTT_02111, partial [Puccinia striiformis]